MTPFIHDPCPACGSRALIIGDSGYLTCGYLECRDPLAAGRALARLDETRRTRDAAAEKVRACDRELASFGPEPSPTRTHQEG